MACIIAFRNIKNPDISYFSPARLVDLVEYLPQFVLYIHKYILGEYAVLTTARN